MRPRITPLALLIALASTAREAGADLVTFYYAGTVSDASGYNAGSPGGARAGSSFDGYVTIDRSIRPGYSTATTANYYDDIVEMTLNVGTAHYSRSTVFARGSDSLGYTYIENNNPYINSSDDYFQAKVQSSQNFAQGGSISTGLTLALLDVDASPAALTSLAVPAALDLSRFNATRAILYEETYNDPSYYSDSSLRGEITYLGLVPVPLPPSIAMTASGLLLVLGVAARRTGATRRGPI